MQNSPFTKIFLNSLAIGTIFTATITLAHANTIIVNTSNDEYDTVANSTCSLREAVESYNIGINFGGCNIESTGNEANIRFDKSITSVKVDRKLSSHEDPGNQEGSIDIYPCSNITIDGFISDDLNISINTNFPWNLRDYTLEVDGNFHQCENYGNVSLLNLNLDKSTYGEGILVTSIELNIGININNVNILNSGCIKIFTYGPVEIKNSTIRDNITNALCDDIDIMSASNITLDNILSSGNKTAGSIDIKKFKQGEVYINNVHAEDNFENGILIDHYGEAGNVTAQNIVSNNNGARGITIIRRNGTGEVILTNLSANKNRGRGMQIHGREKITATNLISSENNEGITISHYGIGNIAFTNILSHSNTIGGIAFVASNDSDSIAGGVSNNYTFENMSVWGNGAEGMYIHENNNNNLPSFTRIQNSTFSGNKSGIKFESDNPYTTFNLSNTTIANNTNSGLIFRNNSSSGSSIFNFKGSLLSANGDNCSKEVVASNPNWRITSNGYNWDDDGTCSDNGLYTQATTDKVGNIGLGLLLDNGGFSSTHALPPGSPAIDAIPASDCLDITTDQRGMPRPSGSGCDIGAFEYSCNDNSLPFTDLKTDNKFYSNIRNLYCAQIVSGGEGGTKYFPDRNVTRAEMAKFIVKAFNLQIPKGSTLIESPFKDSITGNFEEYILTLTQLKIVNGYSDGTYRPDEEVSREMMAAYIFNAMKAKGVTGVEEKASTFSDVSSNNQFAGEIGYLQSIEVVTGYSDHLYHGENKVARDSMAGFVDRAREI